MTEGTPAQARNPGPELVGRTLAGRYRIVGFLGEGAMGSVYVGEHLRIGRRDAIKVLRKSMAKDEEAIARFIRGAKNASRVRHPNVCSIYDCAETDDGVVFLAMEYIEGESLHELLSRRKSLPLGECAHIVRQVAEALQAAHEAGIVHRDLKPANIMLTTGRGGAPVVKVVDFDIAKGSSEGEPSDLTQMGFVIGTPEYMSPEQLTADSLDGRSDVYSLGMVLFRMLTGVLPFASSTSREAMVQRLTAAPRTLAAVAPDQSFPEAVQRVLDRALAREPANRFPDAEAFAETLLQAVRTAPRGAPVDPASPPPSATAPAPLPTPQEVSPDPIPKTQLSWQQRRRRRTPLRWLVPAGLAVAGLVVAWGLLNGTPGEAPVLGLLPETASIRSGEEILIQATLAPVGDEDAPSGRVEWSSSDLSVASVSTTGMVTGVAPGQASILARLGELTARAEITVSTGATDLAAPAEASSPPPATPSEATPPVDRQPADRPAVTPGVEDDRPSAAVDVPATLRPEESDEVLDRQVNRLLDGVSGPALDAVRDTARMIWGLEGVASPPRARAAFVMAQAELVAGDLGAAVRWAERAVELAPDNDGYLRLLEDLRRGGPA